jgi:hypothetical protein
VIAAATDTGPQARKKNQRQSSPAFMAAKQLKSFVDAVANMVLDQDPDATWEKNLKPAVEIPAILEFMDNTYKLAMPQGAGKEKLQNKYVIVAHCVTWPLV